MTGFSLLGLSDMGKSDVILWSSNPLLGIELTDLRT